MLVLSKSAMVPQFPHGFCKFRIVCHDRAAVVARPEILGRIETEAYGIAQRAHYSSVIAPAVSLCSILDHPQSVLARYIRNRIHVRRRPVQIHCGDSFSPTSDGFFDMTDIYAVGV